MNSPNREEFDALVEQFKKMERRNMELTSHNRELAERNSKLTGMLDLAREDLVTEKRLTRNSVSGGFYMMSRKAEKNIRELAKENPTAFLVFSVIRENMQIGTNALTISSSALGKILNKSTRTISRATKFLAQKKFVQIIKVGTSNSYIVNERIAFSGRPNQRMAVFSSTVVAHEVENENWAEVDKLRAIPVIRENERIILGDDNLDPPDQGDLDLQ